MPFQLRHSPAPRIVKMPPPPSTYFANSSDVSDISSDVSDIAASSGGRGRALLDQAGCQRSTTRRRIARSGRHAGPGGRTMLYDVSRRLDPALAGFPGDAPFRFTWTC